MLRNGQRHAEQLTGFVLGVTGCQITRHLDLIVLIFNWGTFEHAIELVLKNGVISLENYPQRLYDVHFV